MKSLSTLPDYPPVYETQRDPLPTLIGYSEETRERVKNISYETDYLARDLKTGQTSAIRLLAPVVSDSLASQVMQGVEEEVQERGYAVMLGGTGAKPGTPPATSAPIFAVSAQMDAAAVNELQRRGLRAPEDVSVLGYDNISTSTT